MSQLALFTRIVLTYWDLTIIARLKSALSRVSQPKPTRSIGTWDGISYTPYSIYVYG
jgi:hypothetical protein